MLFLEAAVTGWPAGLQKIGVRTRGPVTAVPITAPPCQISGGVPLAVSPAVGDWRLSAGHRVWTSRALTMPAKRPMRGPWPFLAQAPGACDEVLGTASAAVLVASRVAVPSATTVRVARRARRLNALAIRVLRSVPGSPGLSAAALNEVLGWTYRFAADWWCQGLLLLRRASRHAPEVSITTSPGTSL